MGRGLVVLPFLAWVVVGLLWARSYVGKSPHAVAVSPARGVQWRLVSARGVYWV